RPDCLMLLGTDDRCSAMPRGVKGMKGFGRAGVVLVASLLSLLVWAQGATAAQRSFAFVSESAKYDAASGEVKVRIVLNQQPDFFTTDLYGRQADSFQYFIVGDAGLPYPSNYDSIIRGGEIQTNSGLLPIRTGDSFCFVQY